jgi:hypothetical protein
VAAEAEGVEADGNGERDRFPPSPTPPGMIITTLTKVFIHIEHSLRGLNRVP